MNLPLVLATRTDDTVALSLTILHLDWTDPGHGDLK